MRATQHSSNKTDALLRAKLNKTARVGKVFCSSSACTLSRNPFIVAATSCNGYLDRPYEITGIFEHCY